MNKKIPKAVFYLGMVSFFTDCSSEMIYPLLPLFLTQTLGATPLVLGVIEGVAESTSSIFKLFSGIFTDKKKNKKKFVVLGYGISGFFRPMVGLALSWPFVFTIRFLDRIGKGLRTSPRDALIASATPLGERGLAYGFHRSMDHAGAVVGPMIASILLMVPFIDIRKVFLLALIPAVVAFLVVIFFVNEESVIDDDQESIENVESSKITLDKKNTKMIETNESSNSLKDDKVKLLDWSILSLELRYFLLSVFVFSLGNSADAFLLLKLSNAGVQNNHIGILWSLHHVIKMISSFYGGQLADHFGDKKIIISGWIFYSFVYFGFSFFESKEILIGIFLVYAIYFGLVEPAEKSLVSRLVPIKSSGTAFGFYHLIIGLSAFPASLVFGWIWNQYGSVFAFLFGSILSFFATAILFFSTMRVNKLT